MAKVYIQGDVIIRKLDKKPKYAKNLKRSKNNILAYGEASGHHHEIRGDANSFKLFGESSDPLQYLKVEKPGVMAWHHAPEIAERKEHDEIIFDKGDYEIEKQWEFWNGYTRIVAD